MKHLIFWYSRSNYQWSNETWYSIRKHPHKTDSFLLIRRTNKPRTIWVEKFLFISSDIPKDRKLRFPNCILDQQKQKSTSASSRSPNRCLCCRWWHAWKRDRYDKQIGIRMESNVLPKSLRKTLYIYEAYQKSPKISINLVTWTWWFRTLMLTSYEENMLSFHMIWHSCKLWEDLSCHACHCLRAEFVEFQRRFIYLIYFIKNNYCSLKWLSTLMSRVRFDYGFLLELWFLEGLQSGV